MLYNHDIEGRGEEAKRFFVEDKKKTEHMNGDKFGLLIDLRSMAGQAMHGSGTRIVNSTDGAPKAQAT